MIKTPTVFVLGAGASKDYGFPLGWELVDSVIKRLSQPSQVRQRFLELTGFRDSDLTSFLTALDGSGQNSVDAFLEYRREFMEIGKAAMSMALVECEQAPLLYKPRDPTQNWMRYLLSQMRSGAFEEFAGNRVVFITFNYDRSLEYFLCKTLADTFGKTEDESGAIVSKIPVVHLHGKLGPLPWEHQNSRPYNTELNEKVIAQCMHGIKVMHEGADIETEEFRQAKSRLAEAKRIYFMGVGFNNLNMQRLGVMDLPDNIAHSTCVGLNGTECSLLSSRLQRKLQLHQHVNCLEMVRAHVAWD